MPPLGMPGGDQRSQQKFIIFENFEKMNTQAARQGQKETELAWLENLQPIAANNMVTIPAPAAAALETLSETASLIYFAAINLVDYFIVFTTAGAGFAVTIADGTIVQFAADGTFSTSPDMTTWQASRILIADVLSGYSTWDGVGFAQEGTVSPNITINAPGNYAVAPTITISGGSGSGATAHGVLTGSSLTSIVLDNPGSGYQATDVLTVTISAPPGSGAAARANMSGVTVNSIQITNPGLWQPNSTPGTYPLQFAGGTLISGTPSGTAHISHINGDPALTLKIDGVSYTGNARFLTPPSIGVSSPNLFTIVNPVLTPIFNADGSVSSITKTASGTGYLAPPNVTIAGGHPNPVPTAHTTLSGTSVNTVVLDTHGNGYKIGETPNVVIGVSAAATAIAHVWPFVPHPSTLAVFQGRVWLGDGTNPQLLQWTGTGATYGNVGYDDFLTADASGSLLITDADLIHQITALRSLNNYLFIVGDNSIKQIGSLSLNAAGNVTLFTILTLSSDQGTIYRNSCISYNRVFLFVSPNGVYGVFGTSVQKISSDLDGIFKNVDFTLPPQGALVDLNRIHNACFLLRYNDPASTTRAILIIFDGKKWWVASQGNNLVAIVSAETLSADLNNLYGSSGTDVRELFANAAESVSWKLQTALTHHGNALQGKRVLEAAITANSVGGGQVSVSIDVDNTSLARVLNLVNGFGMVCVTNDANGDSIGQSGVYLGLTFTGTSQNFTFTNCGYIYQEGTLGKPT